MDISLRYQRSCHTLNVWCLNPKVNCTLEVVCSLILTLLTQSFASGWGLRNKDWGVRTEDWGGLGVLGGNVTGTQRGYQHPMRRFIKYHAGQGFFLLRHLLIKKKLTNLFKFVLVLLSASVERVGVSRMRDFFYKFI